MDYFTMRITGMKINNLLLPMTAWMNFTDLLMEEARLK